MAVTLGVPEGRLFIDGRFVEALGGERFESLNPATGEPLAKVARVGAEDVDRAVNAAHASGARVLFSHEVDVRYRGQHHEIAIAAPGPVWTEDDMVAVFERFLRGHELYGYAAASRRPDSGSEFTRAVSALLGVRGV